LKDLVQNIFQISSSDIGGIFSARERDIEKGRDIYKRKNGERERRERERETERKKGDSQRKEKGKDRKQAEKGDRQTDRLR